MNNHREVFNGGRFRGNATKRGSTMRADSAISAPSRRRRAPPAIIKSVSAVDSETAVTSPRVTSEPGRALR
ncbi:hypothetical protein EVAR_54867_1 [Eumeta japonica]|uniref:Uncharacterized protein n=1 Tax=Eumeta variegata TaxID=151549 RepID=A0A4C1YHJ6_EUMVA|nr:hypothetical protein EVAR_54867_1 [Eumeta japonica]